MLGIITCLRARALAHNWDLHVWLLQRTLDSMLAQTNSDFQIIAVCHEIPDLPHLNHSAVHFLTVDFPLPERTFEDMCADKVLKLTAGIDFAIAAGCNYVMFADGDDLINRHLSELVVTNNGKNGWYCRIEHFYRYGGRWVRKYVLPGMEAGPCVIVASDLLRFAPDPRYRGQRVNTLAAAGHTEYRKLMNEEGTPLTPLPFPGSVVIVHDDSTSNAPEMGDNTAQTAVVPKHSRLRVTLSQLKQNARDLALMRPLTPTMRRDFTIPYTDHIHPSYRGSSKKIWLPLVRFG